MKKMMLLVPAVALVMTGCGSVLSLSPLYTSENVIQDPGLIGTWTDEKGEDILVVRQGEDQAYQVLYTSMQDSAVTTKFEVHLVQLKEGRFLDIVRRTDGWTIPGHSFATISLHDGQAKIAFLDSDWLKEQVLADQTSAARRDGKDLLILMDNTAALQKLAGKYVNESRGFASGLELKRISQ